ERLEHALDILGGEFLEPNGEHDQHDPRGRQPIELVGRGVDDRQRMQNTNLVLWHVVLKHDASTALFIARLKYFWPWIGPQATRLIAARILERFPETGASIH